jgi:hypothetical protein
MRDLRAAIEALATEYELGLGSYVVAESTVAAELRAILAECEEEDIGDATLPLMPTSKRTVTLYEEPAPKSYRCTECGESVADVVVMPDGTRHKGHDGFWCGPVEETP